LLDGHRLMVGRELALRDPAVIRNPHTRRAYARAAGDFLAWCASAGVSSITAVQPLHVAA
jgi:hypothetical protein